jgi:Na+/proline symporter
MSQNPTPKPAKQPREKRSRLSGDEIESRTRAILVLTLAGVLGISVFGILFSVIFIDQPMEQAPNDKAFLEIIQPLLFSVAGALTGLAAGGAIAKRKNDEE